MAKRPLNINSLINCAMQMTKTPVTQSEFFTMHDFYRLHLEAENVVSAELPWTAKSQICYWMKFQTFGNFPWGMPSISFISTLLVSLRKSRCRITFNICLSFKDKMCNWCILHCSIYYGVQPIIIVKVEWNIYYL